MGFRELHRILTSSISTDRKNILKIIELLKNLGYIPRMPVEPEELADSGKVRYWIENKNFKAFSFYHKKDNYKIVDIVLVHTLDFEESFKNKTIKKASGIEIY